MTRESIEAKPDVSQHDNPADNEHGITRKDLALDAASKGQGVSGYETLSLWETVKAFKVNAAICLAVTFSAATDGYQIGYLEAFHTCYPTLLTCTASMATSSPIQALSTNSPQSSTMPANPSLLLTSSLVGAPSCQSVRSSA